MASGWWLGDGGPRAWRGRDALPRVRRCRALHAWKPSQRPLSLMHGFLCILLIVPWTRDAGRAGAHPYHHALRATPGSSAISHQPLATSH